MNKKYHYHHHYVKSLFLSPVFSFFLTNISIFSQHVKSMVIKNVESRYVKERERKCESKVSG